MNICKSVWLMFLGIFAPLFHDNTPLVYTLQEEATVEEIQRCIGEMNYAGRCDLAERLTVEARGDATIAALKKAAVAIDRLGIWQYMLREKDGNRKVRLSLRCADGGYGTKIYVEVADNTIVHRNEEMTPESFHDLVLSGVNRRGLPVRIYLRCLGNTVRDLLDAAELIDVNRLSAELKFETRLYLGVEEDKWELGNWGNWDEIPGYKPDRN